MLRNHFSGLFDLANSKNAVSIILIGNAFVWYFTVASLLQKVVPDVLLWAPAHFSALIISAFVGASFSKHVRRSRLLILWMIMGIASSFMLPGLDNSSLIVLILVSLFLGLSLGFGMPACMSYFTDSVPIEKRGRISGIIMLISGVGMVAFGFAQVENLLLVSIVLGIWRLISLVVFIWAKDYRNIERKESIPSFKRVYSNHSFILYFVPWIMFSIVNYLAVPVISDNDVSFRLGIIQTVFIGSSSVLGGIFADLIGRRRVALAGFSMLGLSAALFGLSGNVPSEIPYPILCFNAAINGVAWGFLIFLFVLTLWGDLSQNSSSDKYYALGVTPFFLSQFLELTLGPNIPPTMRASSALFSLVAFFLFLAVLPLFFAPETLPEKVLKKRELTMYVKKAQQIAEKHT